jgi:uncharacterized membrane protein
MKRNTRIVAVALALIPATILGASTLCTWAVTHGASSYWRLLFRVLCHGIARRCFELWGAPMPICARCSGIYAGMLGGIVLFMLLPRIEERIVRWTLAIAVLPMVLDGLTQLAMLRESTNLLRLATGLLAGAAFAFWALSAVESPVLSTA